MRRSRRSPAWTAGGPRRQVVAEKSVPRGRLDATGWPATMEGAVRSGYLAAEALLASFGGRADSCNRICRSRVFQVLGEKKQWRAAITKQ